MICCQVPARHFGCCYPPFVANVVILLHRLEASERRRQREALFVLETAILEGARVFDLSDQLGRAISKQLRGTARCTHRTHKSSCNHKPLTAALATAGDVASVCVGELAIRNYRIESTRCRLCVPCAVLCRSPLLLLQILLRMNKQSCP